MAKMDIQTKCACGEKLKIEFKKPSRLESSVEKVECKGCKSSYMLTCFVERKPGLRKYNTDIEMIELSPALEKILKDKTAVA